MSTESQAARPRQRQLSRWKLWTARPLPLEVVGLSVESSINRVKKKAWAKSAVWVAVRMIFVCFSFVLNQWTLCIASASPYTGQSIDFWKIRSRVKCPCPEQGRNPNSQLSSAMSASLLPIEPQDHSQPIHRINVNGLVMIFQVVSGSVGKVGANIALESWLFRFRPCSGQGQFTLIGNDFEQCDSRFPTMEVGFVTNMSRNMHEK